MPYIPLVSRPMDPKLTQIQAKIREVCPEMQCYDPENPKNCDFHDDHELELVHVLRAIGENPIFEIDVVGRDKLRMSYFPNGHYDYYECVYWNLTKPLHEQEDSVLDMLFSILC